MKQFVAGLVLMMLSVSLAAIENEFTPPPAVSGYDFLSKDMQSVQDDDFLNPGMVAVEAGREYFNEVDESGQSCASCHGGDGETLDLEKVAAYPRYDTERAQLMTLQDQVLACWTDRLDRFPGLLYNEPKSVSLETFVKSRARGQTINVVRDPAAEDMYELGKTMYNTRFGQMGMTCQHCHIIYQGKLMRGQRLTQGQSNGFPVYRFNSDRLTSLHERFDECFDQLRAVPYEKGGREYRALEYYMGTLSNGLKVETPGVRF